MPRRKAVKKLSSDSSDDEPLSKKAVKLNPEKKPFTSDDSSSDSDIANYLQKADEIDLSSSFFNLQKESTPFDKIENNILAGLSRLTNCNSSSEDEISTQLPEETTSKLNFQHVYDYANKLEEIRKHAEEYEAKKQEKEKQVDISNLLEVGESNKKQELRTDLHSSDSESCSEKEGWEEVYNKEVETLTPKEGVQITVEIPGTVKKKGVDLMAAVKRRINQARKENQILVHKVHLLCWIAHGNYVSSVINSQNILAVALSLLPSEKCYPANRTDLSYLEQIVKWYQGAVINLEKVVPKDRSLDKLLEYQIMNKKAYNKTMLVYIFVAILRSLGIQCRLALSFQVEPLRPPNSELCSLGTKGKSDKVGTTTKTSHKCTIDQIKSKVREHSGKIEFKRTIQPSKSGIKVRNDEKLNVVKGKATSKSKVERIKKPTSENTAANDQTKASGSQNRSSSLRDKEQVKPSKRKLSTLKSTKEKILLQIDGANDSVTISKPNLRKLKSETNSCPNNHPKRLKMKVTKFKDTDSEDDAVNSLSSKNPQTNLRKLKESPRVNDRINLKKLTGVQLKPTKFQPAQSKFSDKKPMDVRDDIINLVKSRIKEQKQIDRMRTVKKKAGQESEENSDYAPEPIKKKEGGIDDAVTKIKVKRRILQTPDDENIKKKSGLDVWAEVFLEAEEKWISVDVVKGQVHCISEIYNRASHPVSYIVAWNNNNRLKDITRRYCQNFNTITRKLRVDARWWEATLKPFLAPKSGREKEEDEELERLQLEKPLPTSITEYKNHPLYVLKRHLLKFQAIYPADAPPLGFVKNEPVYSRHCVHTLHSREVWLKHAKVVKPGEKPYKIVKARARYDKLSNSRITDQMVEIFGEWQTGEYVPPVAENGVVPRNAYGNVELFKPSMLPTNTVHLQLPGLNKIAKRMDIDCAPAVVGFDFHTGGSHPTFDGFVVCEEYADILIAAWELEREELAKKEREKIEKRVYGNWKKLIKGLLIRERLKTKYEFGESSGKMNKKATGTGERL